MSKTFARYEDIDKEQLQEDIDSVKETIGTPTWDDFQHLLKLEKWGRALTYTGYLIMFMII